MPLTYTDIGIWIYMYYDDHNPPHVHIKRAGKEWTMEIKSLKESEGMPNKVKRFTKNFIEKYRQKLLEMWKTQNIYQIED